MSSTNTTPATADALAERQAALRAAMGDHLDRLTWGTERIREHQQERLRALLRVAVERSAFHRHRLTGIDPHEVTLDDLPSLPIMTKAEMMDSYDEAVTDRTLSRAGVEAHLAATGFDAREMHDHYVVLASGGSSGTRGVFAYPRPAAVDFLAGLVRPGLARLVALLGRVPDEPVPMVSTAAGSGVHATRAFASLFGGDIMSVTSVRADQPLDQVSTAVEAAQPLLLQGYPSVVRHLAEERLAGRLDVSPLSVTTTSEPLTEDDRDRIGEAFGVGVCDMFGSSEGLVGVSPPDDPAIVLASDLCIVELVDAAGRPVPDGSPSDRVLVTNLFNPVQPLIRYELTDSMVRLPDAPEHGHARVRVDGRSDDSFRYGALAVHPLSIRTVMVKQAAVIEYQVRQSARGVDVSVVAGGPIDEQRLAGELRASLRGAGLENPEVGIEVVGPERIERHPATGKTRRFIPLVR